MTSWRTDPDREASSRGHDSVGAHHKGPELNPLCVRGGGEWKSHSLSWVREGAGTLEHRAPVGRALCAGSTEPSCDSLPRLVLARSPSGHLHFTPARG